MFAAVRKQTAPLDAFLSLSLVHAFEWLNPYAAETTGGRLRALYDFENRRTRYALPPFFPDVDSRFKFCAFVAGRAPAADPAHCAVFLQDVAELQNPEHRFPLAAEDFARGQPETPAPPRSSAPGGAPS